jgi:hypothetical protein
MKALKRKPGRPRKQNVIREANGRISRAEDPPSKLGLEVRARLHRLTIDQAKDQQAGQWLGRMHMAYQEWRKKGRVDDKHQPAMSISTGQYYALLTYQQLHNDRLKVVSADGAYYERTGAAGLADEEAATRWAESVNKRYRAAREALRAVQETDPGRLWVALDLCVIQEMELPQMIGEVRTLGNTLKKVFGGVDG